jgi:hypothetical protein
MSSARNLHVRNIPKLLFGNLVGLNCFRIENYKELSIYREWVYKTNLDRAGAESQYMHYKQGLLFRYPRAEDIIASAIS